MKQEVNFRVVYNCWLCPSNNSILRPASIHYTVVHSVTVNHNVFFHPCLGDWHGDFTGLIIILQHTKKMIGSRVVRWRKKVNLSLVGLGYIRDRSLFSSASAKVNNMNLDQRLNTSYFESVCKCIQGNIKEASHGWSCKPILFFL